MRTCEGVSLYAYLPLVCDDGHKESSDSCVKNGDAADSDDDRDPGDPNDELEDVSHGRELRSQGHAHVEEHDGRHVQRHQPAIQ